MTTLPETAHRIIFPAPGEVSLERFKIPTLDQNCVRVRTLFSLMSTGTETTILHQRYARGSHFDRMFSFPQLQTGVQAVGIVEALGKVEAQADFTEDQADEISVGDIVYIRHAHASHQIVNATACSVIPKNLDLRAACWAGLAKKAFRAAWAGQYSHTTNTLIFGAGPVGQMLTRWAAALGCPNIIVVDSSVPRLVFASNGGATHTLQGEADQLGEALTEIQLAHSPVVVDCTGNPHVLQSALAAAPMFGKVILLGDTGHPQRQHLSSDLMMKGLTIQAVHESHDRDGWTQNKIDKLFFDKAQHGDFHLEKLITHEFSPRQYAQAYQLAEHERHNTMGILFDWTNGV